MPSMESPTGRRVDAEADRLLGRPYADRGRGPVCYDCFGLFLELAARCGIALEDPFTELSIDSGKFRTFYAQFIKLQSFGNLRPLDLIRQVHARQHVVTVIAPEWVLDISRETGCQRTPLAEALRFAQEAYRLRCLAG